MIKFFVLLVFLLFLSCTSVDEDSIPDSNGQYRRVTKQERFDSDGSLALTVQYNYSDNGTLQYTKTIIPSIEDTSYVYYEYYSNGLIASKGFSLGSIDTILVSTFYYYDSLGKVDYIQKYNSNLALDGYGHYVYDSNVKDGLPPQLMKYIYEDTLGDTSFVKEFEYSDEGYRTKSQTYEEGKLVFYTEYNYNDELFDGFFCYNADDEFLFSSTFHFSSEKTNYNPLTLNTW